MVPLPVRLSFEYHGLVLIQQDPAFDVPTLGARTDSFLDIAVYGHQDVERIPVRDSLHALLDDESFIENFSHGVCGRADQLALPF
jgi:hypothetical protein